MRVQIAIRLNNYLHRHLLFSLMRTFIFYSDFSFYNCICMHYGMSVGCNRCHLVSSAADYFPRLRKSRCVVRKWTPVHTQACRKRFSQDKLMTLSRRLSAESARIAMRIWPLREFYTSSMKGESRVSLHRNKRIPERFAGSNFFIEIILKVCTKKLWITFRTYFAYISSYILLYSVNMQCHTW